MTEIWEAICLVAAEAGRKIADDPRGTSEIWEVAPTFINWVGHYMEWWDDLSG